MNHSNAAPTASTEETLESRYRSLYKTTEAVISAHMHVAEAIDLLEDCPDLNRDFPQFLRGMNAGRDITAKVFREILSVTVSCKK